MNKVILGLGLLASTAAICLVGHGVQYQLHSNNRVLARRLRDAESRLAESQSNVTEIEQRLGARQDEVNRARSDFETARNEAQHAAPPELDPAREGVWPATQPYCRRRRCSQLQPKSARRLKMPRRNSGGD